MLYLISFGMLVLYLCFSSATYPVYIVMIPEYTCTFYASSICLHNLFVLSYDVVISCKFLPPYVFITIDLEYNFGFILRSTLILFHRLLFWLSQFLYMNYFLIQKLLFLYVVFISIQILWTLLIHNWSSSLWNMFNILYVCPLVVILCNTSCSLLF